MRESKFRPVSIILGVFIFFIAVYIMLAVSLPLLGYNQYQEFFAIGRALFFAYKFSAFFIPLTLLYASILLIIPGWSTHSKYILISMPIYFLTCIASEHLLYFLIPRIENSAIQEFAKLAIILCCGLLLLLEIFIALMLAEKKIKIPQREIETNTEPDIIGESYQTEYQEDFYASQSSEQNPQNFFDRPEEPLTSGAELTHKQFKKAKAITEFEPTETIKNFEKLPVDIGVDIGENITPQKRNSLLESMDIIEDDIDMNAHLHDDALEAVLRKIETETNDDLEELEINPDKNANDENIDENIYDENYEEENFRKTIFDEDEDADEYDKSDLKDSDTEIDSYDVYDDIENEGDEEKIDDYANSEPNGSVAEIDDSDEFEVGDDEANEDNFEIDDDEEFEDSEIDEDDDSDSEDEDIEITAAQPLEPKAQEKPAGYFIPYDLLTRYPGNDYWIIDETTRNAALVLKKTFEEFNINIEITGIRKGPVVTMFEVLPPPGIKLGKITALQDNIALRLAAQSVRIVAPIPGKQAVGIEVPNKSRAIVGFRELIETDINETKKMQIPIVLGKDVTGEPQTLDLAQTPHLLIAGATGSGKSVCVNSIILSILYNQSPEEVKLLLVDPKIVELKLYNGIGHLLTPVITEPKKALQGLQYCIFEMERRYAMLDGMSVRDIKSYNRKIKREKIAAQPLPYIVIIIDEFADLMATTGKELEATVSRLCAMSRAVGIHLVLATQRPSTNVITGLIKANIPSRIAFMVASRIDSQIILDNNGAEKLLGRGDMLYVSTTNPFPARIQGTFVSDDEVEKVVEQVKTFGEPEYIDDEIFVDDEEYSQGTFFEDESDPLYNDALEIVLAEGKASASYIQRKLKIGYNRAARIVEEMEERGVVGPANGPKPREVIYSG